MVEKLAGYIQKRIQETRTVGSEKIAKFLYMSSGMTRVELARREAREGNPGVTASFLYRDDMLSVSQKAEILAEAYTKSSEISVRFAKIYVSEDPQEKHQSEAQRSMRIAHYLRLASIKLERQSLKKIKT